jgi:beta-N-acetylhexosaminidase
VNWRLSIAAGVDIVMTAHLRYPAFDTEWPATLSPAILEDLLRKELGFKGVILTDSFSMGAIRNVYGTAEAAVRAINAGADMVMLAEERYGNESSGYLSRQVALIEEIRRAVRDGKIPMARVDEAVGRVLKLKVAAQLFTRGNPNREEAQRVVGSKLNQDVGLEAARAAVLVARNLDKRIPLPIQTDKKIVLVSPIAESAYAGLRRMRGIGPNITEPPTDVLFREIKLRNPAAEMVRIAETQEVGPRLDRLREAGAVIVATENYPLPGFDFPTKPQQETIDAMMAGGIDPIVVGLRDPYELLDLVNARSYIAALGYAPVCAQAAAEVLFGERIAVGNMPVSV